MSTPAEVTRQALARTILLMRDHLAERVGDEDILGALLDTRVAVVADGANLSSPAGQHAFVTTALQVSRSGGQLVVLCPDVRLIGVHAPLTGEYLQSALADVLADLVPGVEPHFGEVDAPVDLAVLIGDTPWQGRANRTVRISGNSWVGQLSSAGSGERWRVASPFGALGAAGLAAAEAFKIAMMRLQHATHNLHAHHLFFAPTSDAMVRLAPDNTPSPTGGLGEFDCVSGGAIVHAALFALARIPGAVGKGRVIEPETSDVTNLNRYGLLRRSEVGEPKVASLARLSLGGLEVVPVRGRYDAALAEALGPTPDAILVGVDDIPSRWAVQRTWPRWLGVGATSHYSAMASFHEAGFGCAGCLHPTDSPGDGPIPTISFVSHWAGLWLASLFARMRSGIYISRREQSLFLSPLRMESPQALWFARVPRRVDCPVKCRGDHHAREPKLETGSTSVGTMAAPPAP